MTEQTSPYSYAAQPKQPCPQGATVSSAPVWRAIRQASARWALIAITIAMVWFGHSSTNAHMQGFYRAADLILVYLVIDPFLVSPLILMGRLKHEAKGNFQSMAREELPQSVRDSAQLVNAERDLERLGFEPAGYAWRKTKHVLMYTATFIHPRDFAGATVAFAQTALRDHSLVTFWTRFSDGTSFDTSNFPLGGLFHQDPQHPIHRFPQLQNAAELYAAHRELLAHRVSSGKAIPLKPDKMIGMLDESVERTLAYQAKRGDLTLDASGLKYSYTWKGAWRHAALNVWWVKPLRRIRNEMQAASELRGLGLFASGERTGSLRPELDNRPIG